MDGQSISTSGVLARVLGAMTLVLLTFNPGGYSYAHWLAGSLPQVTPAQAVIGVLLLIGWVVYLTATFRSLGLLGITLLLALIGALVWFAVQRGWLRLDSRSTLAWIAVFATGLILGIGMCWSGIRRRLAGQADVDEVSGP